MNEWWGLRKRVVAGERMRVDDLGEFPRYCGIPMGLRIVQCEVIPVEPWRARETRTKGTKQSE